MSSWDAVATDDIRERVYTVMDRCPERSPACWQRINKRSVSAAIMIQKHFRGMIVRNPSGVPLPDYWVSRDN